MNPMTVTYIIRSPGTGHSIEELFDSIRNELDRQSGFTSKVVWMPHISRSVRRMWQNLLFLAGRPWPGSIHITGDVHYAVLALPASQTMLTIHDCIILETNRSRPLRYVFFWLLWYYLPMRRAAIVTTVSEKTRQELLQRVGNIAQKVVVVPNGYDPIFVAQPRVFSYKHPILLQIGTASHKNLARLIEAIDGLTCMLVIVGLLTEEAIADLKKWSITYRNYVNLSQENMVQLYANCDIVTFVSTYEGFGMPILEANAIGRVVITSDCSPMREVAAGAAHLVDPTNVAAIRQGILQLIHNDVYRQNLIDAGYQNAQRHSMANVAGQYARLYDQLARKKLKTESAP